MEESGDAPFILSMAVFIGVIITLFLEIALLVSVTVLIPRTEPEPHFISGRCPAFKFQSDLPSRRKHRYHFPGRK